MSNPKFEEISIDLIELLDYNPRSISKVDFQKLCDDIKNDPNFLIQRPPLINKITFSQKYICYAGHQRLLAAKKLGYTKIACFIEENLHKQIQDQRLLKDNLHRGVWDFDKLKLFDLDTLNNAGFELKNLGDYFKETITVEDDNFSTEKVYNEIKEPSTKRGDVFKLGNHRLMCGSSDNIEDVSILMNEDKADVVYCDPPYNIGLSYDKGVKPNAIKKKYTNTVFNDILTNHDYLAWLLQIIDNAKQFSNQDIHVFFWCDPKYIGIIQDAYSYSKIQNKSVCFWIKNNFNPTLQMAFNRLIEPCVYGTIGKPKLNNSFRNFTEILNKEIAGRKIFEGLMDYTDTWVVARENSQSYVHPTQKPCTLHEKPLNRCSEVGDIVMDLFGGSGSTLMACEQMNRSARLMELDPVFCDVIISRWEKYTGKKAIKIH